VSKQSVTNWTQGHSEPSLRSLRAIAQLLDVPLASLLEESGGRPSGDPPGGTTESDAVDLLRELTADPAGPAVRTLAAVGPDLSDLLKRAEAFVGAFDRDRPEADR